MGAINDFAYSIINHGSVEEFKEIFARSMYVESQDGAIINFKVFEDFSDNAEKIAQSLKYSNTPVVNIGRYVATAIAKKLKEIPNSKRRKGWENINDVTFDMRDYEEWLGVLEDKLKRR